MTYDIPAISLESAPDRPGKVLLKLGNEQKFSGGDVLAPLAGLRLMCFSPEKTGNTDKPHSEIIPDSYQVIDGIRYIEFPWDTEITHVLNSDLSTGDIACKIIAAWNTSPDRLAAADLSRLWINLNGALIAPSFELDSMISRWQPANATNPAEYPGRTSFSPELTGRFSAASAAYFLVTGAWPFQNQSAEFILKGIFPPMPEGVNGDLEQAVYRGLMMVPDDRGVIQPEVLGEEFHRFNTLNIIRRMVLRTLGVIAILAILAIGGKILAPGLFQTGDLPDTPEEAMHQMFDAWQALDLEELRRLVKNRTPEILRDVAGLIAFDSTEAALYSGGTETHTLSYPDIELKAILGVEHHALQNIAEMTVVYRYSLKRPGRTLVLIKTAVLRFKKTRTGWKILSFKTL